MFKKYNGILKSFTDSTATFNNGAIIRLSDLSFNGSNFNSLAAGKDGPKDKQPEDKKSKPKQHAATSSSKEQGTGFNHANFDFLSIINSLKPKGKPMPNQRNPKVPLMTNPANLQQGSFYLPPNLAPDNRRLYSPSDELQQGSSGSNLPADLPKNPGSSAETKDIVLPSQEANARSLADALENQGEESLDSTEEVGSEVSELNNECKDMENSPENVPPIAPVEIKTRTYKPKLDPSVILQEGTKRERREPKKFVARTSELKSDSEESEPLDDSFTKWVLNKNKRKKNVPKKPKGARK